MANGKNFIDFILDTQNDDKLAKDFLSVSTPEELGKFFTSKGYKISVEDCEKIVKAKANLNPDDVGSVRY